MTAERPGREPSLGEDGLTADASLANAEAPAVSLCPGFCILNSDGWIAECDECGVTGATGCRCEQLVLV